MKLTLNPMAQLMARAERRIALHRAPTLQDLAHDRKRQLAQAVADGGEPTPEFKRAAEIEGFAAWQLAELILSKPDGLMLRENGRRALVLQVRAARSADEIAQIFTDNDIGEHPQDRHPVLLLPEE